MTAVLPPLDEPCPYCTGPAGNTARRDNLADWRTWDADEAAGYQAFIADRVTAGLTDTEARDPDAWQNTADYQALRDRMPRVGPTLGCVECNWTGLRPTDDGRTIIEFLHTHQRHG